MTLCLVLGLGGYWLTLPAMSQPAAAPEPDAQATDTQATPPADTEEPEPPPWNSREERNMRLLEQSLSSPSLSKTGTAVWLTALEVPFLSLWELDISGEQFGAVLLLNDSGQHSDWPVTSRRIRLSLAEHGWNTLSTQLPAPQPAVIPERSLPVVPLQPAVKSPASEGDSEDTGTQEAATEKDAAEKDAAEEDAAASQAADGEPENGADPAEPAPATADNPAGEAPAEAGQTADKEEPPVPAEDMARARLQASLTYLNQQGQLNIVLLGNGVGAVRAACFAQSLAAGSVRALVLVNAESQVPGGPALNDCLDNPQLPVLDVYEGRGERQRAAARQRLRHSRQQQFDLYQQVRLQPLADVTSLGENRLSRRIRGFLEQHARGQEVDNPG